MKGPELLLDAQLCAALKDLEPGDYRYQGYLARVVRQCLDRLIAGDPTAVEDALRTLNLPLHQAERLGTTFQGLEAATWMRAAAWFFEIAKEAANHNPLVVKTSTTEQRALVILRAAKPEVMRRREIYNRWHETWTPVTEAALGQALTRCHEKGQVVRIIVRGPEGSSYRITEGGCAVLEALGI